MKRKNIYSLIVSSLLLTSVTSCSSNNVFDKVSTINFYDGDNKLITISGKYGTKIDDSILDKITVKDNTTFKGWYRDKEYTTKKENVQYFPFEETVTYYGFFANHVTITLLKDDSQASYPLTYTSSGQEINYKYSYSGVEKDIIENLELPTPSKPQYTFDGWYIKGEDTKFDSRLYPGKDIELYAKFTIYPSLSFVINDKTSIDSILVEPGTILSDAINKAGITTDILYADSDHKFYAWYYDKDYKELVNPSTNIMPTSSITIYAKYVTRKTINFDTSSIDSSIVIPSITCFPGENIEAPSLSSSTLLDTSTTYFDTWYEKNESNNFKEKSFFEENHVMPNVDNDITLYPKVNNKYKLEIYDGSTLVTISYNKPDEEINLNNIKVNDSTISKYISNIESTQDKVFKGFYKIDASSNKIYITSPSNYICNYDDITLYLEFDNKNIVNFTFEDAYNNSIDSLTYSIKTYELIGDPTEILTNYIKNSSLYFSSDFKILKYLDSDGNTIIFPQISKDISYRVLISKLVNVNYNVYTIDSDSNLNLVGQDSISVYQNDTFKKDNTEVNAISNDGSNIYIYGTKFDNIDASKYIFKKATLNDSTSTEIDLYTLGPSNDVSINIYFELKN